MKISKKLLSLVLCMAMLISTMAAGLGLSASADSSLTYDKENVTLKEGVNDLAHGEGYDNSVPTYKQLTDALGASNSFVYYGVRYYTLENSTKTYLSNAAVNELNKGDTVYCEVYYMTNYASNNKVTNIALAFDSKFFDFSCIDDYLGDSTVKGARKNAVNTFFTNSFTDTTYIDMTAFANNLAYAKAGTNIRSIAYVGSYKDSGAQNFVLTKANNDTSALPDYIGNKYSLNGGDNADLKDRVEDWRVVTFAIASTTVNPKNQNKWNSSTWSNADGSAKPLTTFKVTVKDENNAGKGSVLLPSYYYSCNYGSTTKTTNNGYVCTGDGAFICYLNDESGKANFITLLTNTKTVKPVKATYFINDCNCDFSLPNPKVTFMDGDTELGYVKVSSGAAIKTNVTGGTLPDESKIENFAYWKDSKGNIIDLATATVTEDTTFYAVKSTEKVQVTLNLGDCKCTNLPQNLVDKYSAVYNEAAGTITMSVPVTGMTSAELESITISGDGFMGWYNETVGTFTGTFQLVENQTFNALKGIPVKYLPISKAPNFTSNLQSLVGYKGSADDWSTLFYYTGKEYGSALTADDLVAIQKEINNRYNDINEKTGAADYGTDIQFCTGYDVTRKSSSSTSDITKVVVTTSKTLSEETPEYKALNIGTTYNAFATDATIGNYKAGINTDAIYINTAVQYEYNVYVPSFDADGNVETENGNVKYDKQTKSEYYVAIGLKDTEYLKASEYTAAVWTNNLNKIHFTSINNTKECIERYTVPTLTYNEYKYHLSYSDENGKEQDNIIVNKKDIEFSRAKDENGNAINKCATYSCYIMPVETIYHVGFKVVKSADTDLYASVKEYKYGDVVDASAYADMTTAAAIYTKNYLNDDSDFENNRMTLSELTADGEKAGKKGYQLSSITAVTKEGTTVDFRNDANPEIKLDEYVLGKYASIYNANYANKFVSFDSTWTSSEFTFNVYYQNANGEWVNSGYSKTLTADKQVTYANVIGRGTDIDKMIKADCPYGSTPQQAFSKEPNGESFSSFPATDALNEEKSLDVYISYSVDNCYVLVDYNNAYDENGEPNDSTKKRGEPYEVSYGAVVYDPDYVSGSGAEPIANSYLVSEKFNVPSVPDKKQKTDDSGNKLYDPVYEEVTDENGDTVKQIKKDENGNTVYDMSSPQMEDVKSNTDARPYRNCEFNGFKVYYVDGVYSKVENLPDKSEWKEGYNDKNETGAQHVYSTVIIQAQWIADSEFLFRVYDDQKNISFAMGKDWKRYYWNVNGYPCSKGENVLVENRDKYFCFAFKIVKEEDNGYYLLAKTIERVNLNNNTSTNTWLFGTIWPLIKNLLVG